VDASSYWPRVVDAELQARLASARIVVVEGPKACGKTFTSRRVAKSEVLLDIDDGARAAAAIDPALVLDGDAPRLIDEWQVEPRIWNHARRTADDRGRPGQFILSGSAVPADDETRHTGAGRIGRIRMRPMSLFETQHSTGAISLAELLDGGAPRSAAPGLTLADIAERIAVGGWPAFQTLAPREALREVASYLDEIRRADINRIERADADEAVAERRRRDRDPARVARFLQSLARNVATSAAVTRLAADTGGADGALARDTINDYLYALERLMIVEDQPAWAPHLRSKRQMRTSAKRHFVDPSLAVAALGSSPKRLLADLNFLGLLFESLVIRDLRVYAQASDATVAYYADSKDLEVDTIVQTRDGRWAAFEVKLGGQKLIDEGARNLLRFAEQIDTTKSGSAACLGVIVSDGYGFVRDDGVAVIPIGALAP
jgi:predicted AAA+ superfamily ATPase